jgi:hypothetical protein
LAKVAAKKIRRRKPPKPPYKANPLNYFEKKQQIELLTWIDQNAKPVGQRRLTFTMIKQHILERYKINVS